MKIWEEVFVKPKTLFQKLNQKEILFRPLDCEFGKTFEELSDLRTQLDFNTTIHDKLQSTEWM